VNTHTQHTYTTLYGFTIALLQCFSPVFVFVCSLAAQHLFWDDHDDDDDDDSVNWYLNREIFGLYCRVWTQLDDSMRKFTLV
jgi:hypothetical protein